MERKTDQAGKRELYKDKGVDREANWEEKQRAVSS